MTTWQERHIENAERMIAFARSSQPGQIGAVPLAVTTEIETCGSADYPDVRPEALGERPPYPLSDRHRLYEDDFNALVDIELKAGTITEETAAEATANFHVYISSNRFIPRASSPKFYQ